MMAARKFAVPEQAVVEALVGHWPIVRLRDGAFGELMEALPDLGTMRVFVRSKAAIIESVGRFGGYSESGPFFNVQTDTLDMHILPAEIHAIYAVEKWGHDTNSPPTPSSSSTTPATPPSRPSSGKTSPASPGPDRGLPRPRPTPSATLINHRRGRLGERPDAERHRTAHHNGH